jgi:hypothetical protein
MPIYYKVQEGDCISSIAFAHGFNPETIWDHPQNAELCELRGNLNVLLPGDVVFVPDRQPKIVAVVAGQRHRFRRKRVPEVLRIRFLDAAGRARAGLSYTIEIGDVQRKGSTGGDGTLEEPIPPNARAARIVLEQGEEQEVFEVRLGDLDPVTVSSGIQARLRSLGYGCGSEDGEVGPHTRIALADFQRDHQIEVTGQADEGTVQRIKEEYRGKAK